MDDYLVAEDRDYLRAVLAAFFDERYAGTVRINESVVEVVGEMLDHAADCTEWMSYVPKPVAPVGPRPGINYALKQLRRVGRALISDTGLKVTFACKKAVAWGFRRRIDLASSF